MRPLLLALLCLLLPTLARPVSADTPPPTRLRPDILYTHRGEFVQVKPMRPLTLNAHVTEFVYDPLGIEIAYSGSSIEGDRTTYFVKTVDTRTGHELSQMTLAAPTEDRTTALSLIGWSVSGKYLLLKKFAPDPNQPGTAVTEFLRWDISVSPPTTRVIQPQAALPPEQQSADLTGSADCYPSPDGRWLAFRQEAHTLRPDGTVRRNYNAYLLYDPERDTFKPLSVPPKASVDSWSDASHLKFWEGTDRKQLDVITGQISLQSVETKPNPPAVSKQYPDLSLDTQNPTQSDAKGSDSYLSSYLIWIRRTPFGKTPLGVAAAGLMPRPHEMEYTGGGDPQAIWSPTGKQVAFAANGDVYVTDLAEASGAMPHEKLAIGVKLSCEDERDLAVSNLKQIGLALIQYSQDYDEHYPPTAGIEDAIYPYLKTRDVFSVGSARWVYHGAANVSMASIDEPAQTIQATMDLPCSHVVLFFDGHVKAFAK